VGLPETITGVSEQRLPEVERDESDHSETDYASTTFRMWVATATTSPR